MTHRWHAGLLSSSGDTNGNRRLPADRGTRIKYYEIELENVLIGMVKPHLGGGETYLSEIVNLKYAKIKWRYTQQRVGGGAGGNTVGGWDLAANKVA